MDFENKTFLDYIIDRLLTPHLGEGGNGLFHITGLL